MGITIVIVAGIIVVTIIAGFSDYMAKKHKAAGKVDPRVDVLERRLEALEAQAVEKDKRLDLLEHNLDFMNRLIEDKSGK